MNLIEFTVDATERVLVRDKQTDVAREICENQGITAFRIKVSDFGLRRAA